MAVCLILGQMLYRFDRFELDTDRMELRADGTQCAVEPQVFALLVLLVENRDRMVSKDEIVEKIWEGRIVSDAAVASRVKSARQVLGDDGKAQRLIRTLHRRGLRFVAAAIAVSNPQGAVVEPNTAAAGAPPEVDSRPSIAVLPFRLIGTAERHAGIADALPHELIAAMSRLRWLFVTARGSSFRFRSPDADIGEAGRLLGVRYVVSGTVEISRGLLAVTVELIDIRDGGIVWADRFVGAIDEVHRFRAEIMARIITALEIRIPMHEASLARLAGTQNLDAWSAYHLGLQHMYRFNRNDNAAARTLFEQAVQQDPDFARAYAGLSFVHFQTAFLRHTNDLADEITLARRYAARGLELDPIDPFVNFTMGRSFWLEGDLESSLGWLERATSISPHYAQGIYARAWTETLAGRGVEGRAHVDLAMRLSPLDPLYYGMLGTRAFSHMATGEDSEAAVWAERAARAPGAHALISMIASAAHALAGDRPRAQSWAADVRIRNDLLRQQDFFRSFPMKCEVTRKRVADALASVGF